MPEKTNPILVVRMPFHTPVEHAQHFYESVDKLCEGYNTIAVRGRNEEVQFEVHSVLKVDPIELEELKKKLLNEFEKEQPKEPEQPKLRVIKEGSKPQKPKTKKN